MLFQIPGVSMTTENSSIFSSVVNSRGDMSSDGSLELFLEFLNCIMTQDFSQALILCRQILETEPENKEAREFLPLLVEADRMKSTGFFHSYHTPEDSGTSDVEEEDNSEQDESSSSDSSESFEYSSSDSDSYSRKTKHK
ncbi:hypothetical protein D915_004806 [Fasciola hepatica]|uniref:Glutamate-rich protein 2 n=1 Tax=Fasciola hepatica TaxID=6192 RepID=A0A4E0RA37_FASHE|nr:hypothetical protein D915_004806 [Fasciola hepatica]